MNESFYKTHPMFGLAQDVKTICQPFFDKLNINYFDYIRFTPDNSFIGLVSDAEWVEHFFKRQYALGCTLKNSGMHLWQAYHHEPLLNDAKKYFNHDHGVSIFLKNGDCIEYFDFAAPSENRQVLSTYFNNQDVLLKFCDYFLEKADPLLAQAKARPIVIPSTMKGELITDLTLSNLPHDLLAPHLMMNTPFHDNIETTMNTYSFTHREVDVLKYLMRGKTAKEIAAKLNISRRTVEAHLCNVKGKAGVSTRSALIDVILNQPISSFRGENTEC